jgi:hypothetical protein
MLHSLGATLGSNVAGAAYFLGWSLARNVAWRRPRVALLWITAIAVAGNVAAFAQTATMASGAGHFGPSVAVGWPNRLLIVALAA